MKYMGICLVSKDLEKTKVFYKSILGARVISDFGANITFTGGFSFQTIDTWSEFLGKKENEITLGANASEL